MRRPLWKGSISFGLVNIPVKMYTASREREYKFVLLHKKDNSKIKYARICKEEEKEVPWSEIVKGYEYKPGEYIVLDEEDFKQANLAKTKSIEIVDFVNEDEIPSVYYTTPYYLEPEKNAASAYALLREALRKSKKVGIGKFVIHNKEHIAVIKPYENAIIINQLRYDQELLDTKQLVVPAKEKISSKEMDVALKLIDFRTTSFNPKNYKDTYSAEIGKIIQAKAKGKKIKSKGESPKPTKVQDIMSLLKASLEERPAKRKRAVRQSA